MPSNRKGTSKPSVLKSQFASEDSHKSRSDDVNLSSQLSNGLTMPKHISLPVIPSDGELMSEFILFVFTVVALGLQYLNLYRTVWWLPHSYRNYAMNIHFIDLNLTIFIVVILGRRVVWSFCKEIIEVWCPTRTQKFLLSISFWTTTFSILLTLLWCMWKLAQSHSFVNTFYLLSPIFLFVTLFQDKVGAFFELVPPAPLRNLKTMPRQKSTAPVATASAGPDIYHICSTSSDVIREEVEHLKTDFNNRMKLVLFNSILIAYYATFIPCSFAQSTLYYDVMFSTQHLVLVWVGAFILCLLQMYPPRYCDVLHCAARHLGSWQKVSNHNSLSGSSYGTPQYQKWSESVLWQQGTLVKHSKEVFRGEGLINAAEPGNVTHRRFYVFFKNPSVLLKVILFLETTVIFYQMVQLCQTTEWHQIICLTILLISNYYSLFKLIRDYIVLGKSYMAEDLLQKGL